MNADVIKTVGTEMQTSCPALETEGDVLKKCKCSLATG